MRIIERIASEELGCVFRDQTRRDFGIDCLLELLNDRNEATGRLIAVQIKCGDSYFDELSAGREGYLFRGDPKHLNYWLGHSLPVIVVLCKPESQECVYTQITAANVRQTEKGWSAVLPREQKLDRTARTALVRLSQGPLRQDLIELALLRHLVERWGDRLRICSVTESPRDFHRFPHLVTITGETGGTFGVQFIDTALRPFDVEAVAEEIKWQKYNERATGGGVPGLMLFVVGENAEASEPPPELEAYLSRQEALRWYRVIYEREGQDFTELDETGRVVWHWPGEDDPYHVVEPD